MTDPEVLRETRRWKQYAHEDLSLAGLTRMSVEARYRGEWSEATHEDARSAVDQAADVVAAVDADLADRGFI